MFSFLCVAVELGLTGDTPNVTGNTVDIQFLLQGCADVSCSLTGGNPNNLPPAQDCNVDVIPLQVLMLIYRLL